MCVRTVNFAVAIALCTVCSASAEVSWSCRGSDWSVNWSHDSILLIIDETRALLSKVTPMEPEVQEANDRIWVYHTHLLGEPTPTLTLIVQENRQSECRSVEARPQQAKQIMGLLITPVKVRRGCCTRK
jgi:hypothetical protein